jgi:uncharacterized protein with GYD domain
MEHYLLRLSYTPAGWQDIIDKAADFDTRLDPVRRLLAYLGGSFATFHFYDTAPFEHKERSHVVSDKFAMFGGHDLMAVLAMPDKNAAKAFSIAISAQPGVKTIELTSIMPFEAVITNSVKAAKAAIGSTAYAGPIPKGS